MKVSRSLVALALAGLVGVLGGCKEEAEPCALDGGEADGGLADGGTTRECVIPEVECGSGEHSEYGLCVADTDEIVVPAGTFDMGAPSGTEFPQHTVSLGEFRIDRTEVTNERYQACVEAGCCTPPTYDGSYSGRQPYYGNSLYTGYPVIFVTWEQALEYCEGLGKGLPTEAQWEYAARGDDGRLYPWGSDAPTSERANYNLPRDGDTAEVGTHQPGASPSGLEDMAGNVWEWVADWYSESYYLESPTQDPPGPETGVARVARGGSFGSAATELYAFYRVAFHPFESFSNLGFRCAR